MNTPINDACSCDRPTTLPRIDGPARRPGRRQFLRQTLAAATGAATLFATGTCPAIEPFRREGFKFKSSLAAYSYRSLLQRKDAPLTLMDFIDDCARFGLDGTELTSYYFPASFDNDYLYRLRQRAFQQGLDVSGTAVGNDFGHPPGPQRDAQIALVETWIEHAARLGAPVIRIFAGKQHSGVGPERTHELIVQAIEHCCQKAGRFGIHLALENHGGPTATAEGLLALVEAVQSPWFGVNLDTGNFHSRDIYGDLHRVAPYALNVQVKVAIRGPDGPKRPTDYARLADILRQSHYRGYVVLEFEEAGDPRVECEKALAKIRQAFAF